MKRYNFASSTSPCVIPLLLRGPWKFLHLWLVLTLGLLCTGLLQFRRHSGQSPTKWLSLETSGASASLASGNSAAYWKLSGQNAQGPYRVVRGKWSYCMAAVGKAVKRSQE